MSEDELKQKIMEEIGLGKPYKELNGSPECKNIRIEAYNKLANVLLDNSGGGVAYPDQGLLNAVEEVAKNPKGSDKVLTNAWKIISDVITVHIDASGLSPEEQERYFRNAEIALRAEYDIPKISFNTNGSGGKLETAIKVPKETVEELLRNHPNLGQDLAELLDELSPITLAEINQKLQTPVHIR